jgi:hypothetical protein
MISLHISWSKWKTKLDNKEISSQLFFFNLQFFFNNLLFKDTQWELSSHTQCRQQQQQQQQQPFISYVE